MATSIVRVKLLVGLAGLDFTWPSGSEQVINKDWADRLIKANQAELIKTTPSKTRSKKK